MILDAWGWYTGTTQGDGTGREEEGGFRMGNTCTPVVDSCWCMAKPIQYCKVSESEVTQSCLTLHNPTDCSLPGSFIHGIFRARVLEWVAIVFSSAWKWKVKVKSLSRVRLCATPETAAHQALPSLGFSRQEHWSGLPFTSPMHESEKWKWSHSVVSDSSQPHGLQPTRLLRTWNFPGKSTGVGCHCLLQDTAEPKLSKQIKKIFLNPYYLSVLCQSLTLHKFSEPKLVI